ncbi:MAG TPA: hypothetical protein PKE29_13385 [Phycisphaerales bacterium]|nr:hypothetical protein [Phycisphaerales bacterium]
MIDDDPGSSGRVGGWDVPRTYAKRAVMVALEVCERFGMDPFGGWWESLDAGQQTTLIAFERFKSREESIRGSDGG